MKTLAEETRIIEEIDTKIYKFREKHNEHPNKHNDKHNINKLKIFFINKSRSFKPIINP